MTPRAELDPVLLTFVAHLDLKKEVSVLCGTEEVQQQSSKCVF